MVAMVIFDHCARKAIDQQGLAMVVSVTGPAIFRSDDSVELWDKDAISRQPSDQGFTRSASIRLGSRVCPQRNIADDLFDSRLAIGVRAAALDGQADVVRQLVNVSQLIPVRSHDGPTIRQATL